MQRFRNLSLAWRVALAGIVTMGVVLAAAFGIISSLVWHGVDSAGHKQLKGAAESVSRLIDGIDETSRANAVRMYGVFGSMLSQSSVFNAAFSLRESTDVSGRQRALLMFGADTINGDHEHVDRFAKLTGGAAAIYARMGDDFEPVATSLKKPDGTRVLGTPLGKQHPAYANVMAGSNFTGREELFGRSYMTHLEPFKDDKGRVVGFIFIGFDMSDLLASLRRTMQTLALFDGGRVYAVDLRAGPSAGNVFGFDQPRRLDEKDVAAGEFFRQLQSGGEAGALEPMWSTIDGHANGPQRDVRFVRNKLWGWAVVAEVAERDMMSFAYSSVAQLWAAAAAAVALLAAALVWVSRRMISHPVGEMSAAIEILASGDLTRLISTTRNDELGQLINTIERFRLRLNESLGAVKQSSETIRVASTEIAHGNEDLSSRTEQQAANLAQTAASMEQMTSTVNNNADAAKQANQLASSASEVAARGGHVVGEVVTRMGEISASSKKIADIIGVIDGIAFQTNILALNAAVEAARAGEQGRGFAVVAAEVRNLAQRSAQAAREIKSLIADSVAKVEGGAELVNEAGRTMTDIVSQVRRVTDLIGEITSATLEQTGGITQVNQAVGQLDQMTQQNAALVEQSAAAAESLKDQAARLADAVAVFKLTQAKTREAIAVAQASANAAVARPAHKPAATSMARNKVAAPKAAAQPAAAPATNKPSVVPKPMAALKPTAAPKTMAAPKPAAPSKPDSAAFVKPSGDWEEY